MGHPCGRVSGSFRIRSSASSCGEGAPLTGTEFPVPAGHPLDRWSPSAVARTRRCKLAQAFSQDEEWRHLSRPTTHSVLGTAAHALAEDASRGRLGPATAEAEIAIDQAWSRLLAQARAKLESAWQPAIVPPTEQWPNYALISMRAR